MSKKHYRWLAFFILGLVVVFVSIRKGLDPSGCFKEEFDHWKAYAGSSAGIRYSSNDQINSENVEYLKFAWRYKTPDKGVMQCNPIVVNNVLYGTSPRLKLFALDAATGLQKWLFDPADTLVVKKAASIFFHVNRGVTYWQDEDGTDKRILYSVGARIFALNATSGTLVRGFGDDGSIDMRHDLDHEDSEEGFIKATSPGIIYRDLLIMGSSVSEQADALPGHIRAFDVRTGKKQWIFHTIPHPGEFGYETWKDPDAWKRIGGANNWGGMALDEKRGIVYIPTGSAGSDFYGGIRKGSNLFANSIIALDAVTGKYIWHYQVIHHDLWDWDLPANPNLITVNHKGKRIDAVAQISKHGFIFLLDRTNGKPLFPVEEKSVPSSDLPGEEAWPTQPFPILPEPFARQSFQIDDVTDIRPEMREDMILRYKRVRHNKIFTPPSKEGSFVFPGFDGGGEWGGSAVDPESGILYVNANEVPSIATMIDIPKSVGDKSFMGIGLFVYDKYCLSCHGKELQGNGSTYPALISVRRKLSAEQVRTFIENGRNMMPPFKHMPENEMKALLTFLMNTRGGNFIRGLRGKETSKKSAESAGYSIKSSAVEDGHEKKNIMDEIPYSLTGYEKFLDQDGYPGIKPPWGTLNAINLNTGKRLWKVPLGEVKKLKEKSIPLTGTENYGGPLVTKGGLVFIAGTPDEKIRAFEKNTGKVLWEADLPAAGYATPATYLVGGRQYLVIACGGGKLGSKSGDEYVAFALPEEKKN